MSLSIEKSDKSIIYIFDNDSQNKKLRLLVVLSPIFIASFDNSNEELDFLKKSIEKSKFPYGLYPNFFDGFDIASYRQAYENYQINEDIYLNPANKIEFIVNPMDDSYILALKAMIESLIIDDRSRRYFLEYFAKIRNDIVINGRRSILANGIQGFYLSKYVVVWMLDLCEYIRENFPDKSHQIQPIYKLANNLKTPRNLRSNNAL